jgi:hypothetical protein
METLLITPFRVLRKQIGLMLVPGLPIFVLIAFIFMAGVTGPAGLLRATDSYLGGNIYFSAADLTAYGDFSTHVQLPMIRLGGIAENASLRNLAGQGLIDIILVMFILMLGFLSYSMVSRSVYNMVKNDTASMITAINPATMILAAVASFLMIFISSFSLAGFELILTIAFGIYFTFSIPYAAIGEPLGESIFKGFGFISNNMGRIVASYIGSMGIAIMAPIGLLVFTTPLLVNLNSPTVTDMLKIFLGLVSVMFALFYQMALCAMAVFEK